MCPHSLCSRLFFLSALLDRSSSSGPSTPVAEAASTSADGGSSAASASATGPTSAFVASETKTMARSGTMRIADSVWRVARLSSARHAGCAFALDEKSLAGPHAIAANHCCSLVSLARMRISSATTERHCCATAASGRRRLTGECSRIQWRCSSAKLQGGCDIGRDKALCWHQFWHPWMDRDIVESTAAVAVEL